MDAVKFTDIPVLAPPLPGTLGLLLQLPAPPEFRAEPPPRPPQRGVEDCLTMLAPPPPPIPPFYNQKERE